MTEDVGTNWMTQHSEVLSSFMSDRRGDLCYALLMDDSEISILDSMRFDFLKKISISNYERFLPSISRLVHLAQSVAAATINVANLV